VGNSGSQLGFREFHGTSWNLAIVLSQSRVFDESDWLRATLLLEWNSSTGAK